MTPSLRWVFLLALVGCAASIPSPLVDDACVLLCHPGVRSSPEGVCELRGAQSGSVLDLARITISRCLKLCDHQLPSSVRVSCSALRLFLGACRGCRCPSTLHVMRTDEKIPSLVDELAMEVVSSSPLGAIVITVLHEALFREDAGSADGYDLIADDYESGGRLAHHADNEKPKRPNVEQPPMDIDGHDVVRLLQNDQTDSEVSDYEEDQADWALW